MVDGDEPGNRISTVYSRGQAGAEHVPELEMIPGLPDALLSGYCTPCMSYDETNIRVHEKISVHEFSISQ